MPVFILLPLFWGITRYPIFYFEEEDKSIKISFRLVFITAGIYFLYRMILAIGINFG